MAFAAADQSIVVVPRQVDRDGHQYEQRKHRRDQERQQKPADETAVLSRG